MVELNEALKEQGYIAASEAARDAGVSIYTIYNWLSAGKIRGMRSADHWYVERDSLVEYVGPQAIAAVRKMLKSQQE